mgnify:CR=1 FL=1
MLDHDIHAAPNIKSTCVIERSFDTNQDFEQLYELPNPHKSFDLSHHIVTSKASSKPQTSRRAMSSNDFPSYKKIIILLASKEK